MKTKLPTVKVQLGKRSHTVPLLAFFPNLHGSKNSAYVITPNSNDIEKDGQLVRTDGSGAFLYVNEMALPMSTRVSLHRQSRQMKDKPLIYDERARTLGIL